MDVKAFQNSPSGRLIYSAAEYWAFAPDPLPPKIRWTSSLMAVLSEADRAIGELAGLGRSLPNPHLLIRPFLHREAVLSSRIEGTQATLPDLYVYEATQLRLFELPSDVHEVHNYVQALEYGLARLQTFPLSLRLLREIHALLMEGVRGEFQTPGEFRRSQNWIGPPGCTLNDANYVPPPVDEMLTALHDMEGFLYASSELPPLIRLGMIHYQFEAIHPFLDGNGRIGRLLITLLLCAWDLLPEPLLYLSVYFEEHRQSYYDLLLKVSQHGAWQEWLSFFLQGISAQSRDAIIRAQHLQTLRKIYRRRFQTARASARLLQVVDLLFSRPVFTVTEISNALQVHYPTAQRYVNRLVEEGVLREITGQVRNRVYQADEILQVLEEKLS